MEEPQRLVPIFTGLLDRMPVGVIVLDEVGRVVHFNRYEEQLARRKRANVLGRDFFNEIAPCMNVRELGGRFFERIGRDPLDVRVEFSFPFPFMQKPRDVVVQMSDFVAEGRQYGCLFVEDVSHVKAVERMKETLSSLLVHDLKNPLALMTGNLSWLRDRPELHADPSIVEAIGDSLDAGARLQRMILNLLDVTRLETNTFPLRRASTDLGAFTEATVRESQAIARSFGRSLVAELPAQPLRGFIDVDVLRRALDNLIENGIRHARSRVIVRVEANDGVARFEVCDDGPGVPDALRARIFEKYQQAEGGGSYNRGLGLTFVRLAARAHGGEASVECPPSGGAIFRVIARIGDDAPETPVPAVDPVFNG